jgi:hypothetical protein
LSAVFPAFDPEDRDYPLALRYDPPADYLDPLGLPHVPTRIREAGAQIVAIAIAKTPDWVSYSRNQNHYSRRGRRYDERPDLYRHSVIVRAVEWLADGGWIENNIAPANPRCGRQSVFRATAALLEALGKTPLPAAKPKQKELIQLRNAHGQLIDFDDTVRTDRMRRHLVEINEAMTSNTVELPVDIGERCGDFLVIGGAYVNLSQNALWRIFNVDFRRGGRFYGPGCQTLPKALRHQMLVNGEPVAEPDYPSHHPRILYGLKGLPLIVDPYDLGDRWPRESVKRAVLILINAPTRQSVIGALVHDPELGLGRKDAERLIEDMKRKHKPIGDSFHSGIGCHLQRIDSDMTEKVLLGLTRLGVPVLPVHDSYIVTERHEGVARDQMDEAFETVILRERGVSRKRKVFQPVKTEQSYTMVACSPVRPSFPSPSFPPPGPLPSCGVASIAFFDAGRRITPLGRLATLDAQRRRNIEQAKLAHLVGISRPTLANILAGRFGASQQTVERIADVIASTPAFERQPFLPGLAA